MRIIVMGTGPFAVPTSERLLKDGHDIPLVVTRPLPNPAPKKIPSRPVWDWATNNRLAILEPTSINDSAVVEELRRYEADLFFVCDYGQILSNECLGTARLGGINLHGSILPRHRGAAPVQWALLRGDQEAGVTVIHMTPKLDAGPALAIGRTAIVEDETAEQLEPRLAELGIDATVRAVDFLSRHDNHESLGVVQDQTLVTKAPRFAKSDGQLDFRLPAEYLVRLIRATQPWPGSFAELGSKSGKTTRLKILAARSVSHSLQSSYAVGQLFVLKAEEIGEEWSAPWDQLLGIRCGEGLLLVSRVQPAGKRAMIASEYLRGHVPDSDSMFLLPDPPKAPLC